MLLKPTFVDAITDGVPVGTVRFMMGEGLFEDALVFA